MMADKVQVTIRTHPELVPMVQLCVQLMDQAIMRRIQEGSRYTIMVLQENSVSSTTNPEEGRSNGEGTRTVNQVLRSLHRFV